MNTNTLSKIKLFFKGKIFFLVFALLITGSVAVTFWRIVIQRDYIISVEQECDPAVEACFIYECDPADDSECPQDEAERISYYKLVNKNAKNIPPCDPSKEECPTELSCEEGEADCQVILCDEDSVPEGETCNDPEEYIKENPPEEECDCSSDDSEEDAIDEDSLDDGNDNVNKAALDENENSDAIEEETATNENASIEDENGNDEGGCSCDPEESEE